MTHASRFFDQNKVFMTRVLHDEVIMTRVIHDEVIMKRVLHDEVIMTRVIHDDLKSFDQSRASDLDNKAGYSIDGLLKDNILKRCVENNDGT